LRGDKISSGEASRESWRWRLGTLAIAVVGALTGIAGLVLGLEAREEERQISLSGHATVTTHDTNHGLHIIRLSLANAGLRGVVVQDASLWVNGKHASTAIGFFPEFQSLEQASFPGEKPLRRQSLPFTLPERQAAVVGFVMEPTPGSPQEDFGSLIDANNKRFHREVLRATQSEQESPEPSNHATLHGIVLRLTTVPGATKDFPVEQLLEEVEPTAPESYFDVEVQAPRSRRAIITLFGLPGRLGASMVLMRLWAASRSAPVVSVERPLNKRTFLPLGQALPAGRYEVAFSVGGQLIYEGEFHAPCNLPLSDELNSEHPPCGAAFYGPYKPHIDE
jgi:hypothetical protein